MKSRNEIYSRLALTEGKLTLHHAFCAREDAHSSPVDPPVLAMCQLTCDTVFVCSLYVCVVLVSTFKVGPLFTYPFLMVRRLLWKRFWNTK